MKYPPGYYQTSYRALRLREMIRMHGIFRLPLVYIITRFKRPLPAAWMPQLWADLECTKEELSDRFFISTETHRLEMAKLGFHEIGFMKLDRLLNPNRRDDGGIVYLDASRSVIAQLFYMRMHVSPPVNVDRDYFTIAFTAVFPHGTFSCTNTKHSFDSIPGNEVLRFPETSATTIHQRFTKRLRELGVTPQSFSDVESLRTWFDSNTVKVFENRVERGLFLRMSEAEVAASQAR